MRSVILGTHICICIFICTYNSHCICVCIFTYSLFVHYMGFNNHFIKGETLFLALTFVIPSTHSIVGRTQALYRHLVVFVFVFVIVF